VPQLRRKTRDGVYEAESFFDDDGVTPDERVRIHAKVTVKSGNMTIDLSGCFVRAQAAVKLAHARRGTRGLQGAHRAARPGERRLVSRASTSLFRRPIS